MREGANVSSKRIGVIVRRRGISPVSSKRETLSEWEHGAIRVTLNKVTHRLPTMEHIRAGGTLNENYTEEFLETFSCDEL